MYVASYPILVNFMYLKSLSWGTLSNAFEKSRIAMSSCFPLSNDCSIACIVIASWVSQEYPDLKP